MKRPCEDAADDVKTVRAARLKEWWASVLRLMEEPDAAAAMLRAHEPDSAGLCRVCVDVCPGDARNLPWPCPTHSMAENALILRAQRDRTDRDDDRPLR